MTRTPLSRSKGQKSTCRGRGHIVAASHTACYNSIETLHNWARNVSGLEKESLRYRWGTKLHYLSASDSLRPWRYINLLTYLLTENVLNSRISNKVTGIIRVMDDLVLQKLTKRIRLFSQVHYNVGYKQARIIKENLFSPFSTAYGLFRLANKSALSITQQKFLSG